MSNTDKRVRVGNIVSQIGEVKWIVVRKSDIAFSGSRNLSELRRKFHRVARLGDGDDYEIRQLVVHSRSGRWPRYVKGKE